MEHESILRSNAVRPRGGPMLLPRPFKMIDFGTRALVCSGSTTANRWLLVVT